MKTDFKEDTSWEVLVFGAIVQQAVEDVIQGALLDVGIKKVQLKENRDKIFHYASDAKNWLFNSIRFSGKKLIGEKIMTMQEYIEGMGFNISPHYIRKVAIAVLQERLDQKANRRTGISGVKNRFNKKQLIADQQISGTSRIRYNISDIPKTKLY